MKKLTNLIFVTTYLSVLLLMSGCKEDPEIAKLTTTSLSDITLVSAKSGGNITDDGGEDITARGVCWDTAVNPTIASKKSSDGTGAGSFSSQLTDLTEGTMYYLRSYATNSVGTAYGEEISFITVAAGLPSVVTKAATDITFTSANSGGDISSNGGAPVTAKGICWSTKENPTITDSLTTNGVDNESFGSIMSGLLEGTTYYVRAYATNKAGTSYGNQVTFVTPALKVAELTTKAPTEVSFTTAKSGGDVSGDGGSPVTAKGVCWNTAENPTITNSVTNEGTNMESYVSTLTGLAEGTTYYVRAYATNKAGTSYGNQVTFVTLAVKLAELTTAPVTTVTVNSVVTGGSITSNGGADITASGVCWGTSPNPTTANSVTTDGTASGNFVSNITRLNPGTRYYIRSYATNRAGTTYGNEHSFITSIADVEGNVYRVVAIGNQIWMAENLKSTRFNNNTPIPQITDSVTWISLTTPGFTWFRNRVSNKETLGGLYNYFAAATGQLCPTGWHIPTNNEFQALEMQLGIPADTVQMWGWRGTNTGTHLKNTTGWNAGGNGDNQSGFAAIGSGYRAWLNGQFRALGDMTYFWSSTDDAANLKPNSAYYRRLDANNSRVYKATSEKTGAKSIRCLKNP